MKAGPDANKEFARIAENGTIVATMNSVLPRLDLSKIVIGMGNPRADEKLQKGKYYADIARVGKGRDSVFNQWTIMDIMEPFDKAILNRPPRMINGRPERKIGKHFARFGFPKANIGPILETVNTVVPGVLENTSSTPGYYWTKASWGVHTSSGPFMYFNENRTPPPNLPSPLGHAHVGPLVLKGHRHDRHLRHLRHEVAPSQTWDAFGGTNPFAAKVGEPGSSQPTNTGANAYLSFRGSADYVRCARTVNLAMLNVKINARPSIDGSITPSEIALHDQRAHRGDPHGGVADVPQPFRDRLAADLPADAPGPEREEKKPVEEMILEDIEKAVTGTTPVKVPPARRQEALLAHHRGEDAGRGRGGPLGHYRLRVHARGRLPGRAHRPGGVPRAFGIPESVTEEYRSMGNRLLDLIDDEAKSVAFVRELAG
ncbi:hypothetical protein DL765_011198 [Monosporascus sp. GIB2]|nr:hypothetical protein DL765_011198 [Monosporascus sp. GIB2]